MKHWPKKLLADAYWFQEGPGVRKWQFCSSGIKLLNVANITKEGALDLSKTDRYLNNEEVSQKYSHFLADAGDLVIASSGISFDEDGLLRTRGAFIEQKHLPLCLNTSTIRFKSKKDISSLAWLRYWLDSVEFREQITRLVTGSAQQNFGPSHLKATKITLPPLAEQERIVKILDEADELRKLRAQADHRTADLIPALFHEMFGDPATNPKKWKLTAISETATVQGGLQLTPLRDTYALKRPYLRVANIQRGFMMLDEIKKIGLLETEYERTKLIKGDLLLVEGNGNPKEVGRAAIWNGVVENCVHQNHLIRVRPNPRFITSDYLLAFVNSESGRNYFHGSGNTTSGLVTISTSIVKNCRIPVPLLSLQNEFAQRVAEIREMEAEQAKSKSRLDALFHSLLHRAFEGEL